MSVAFYWSRWRWFRNSLWLTGCTYVTSALRQWHWQAEIHLWQVWKEVENNEDTHCQLHQNSETLIICRPIRGAHYSKYLLLSSTIPHNKIQFQFQPQVGVLILFLPLLLSFTQKCKTESHQSHRCRWGVAVGHCCSSGKPIALIGRLTRQHQYCRLSHLVDNLQKNKQTGSLSFQCCLSS